MHMYIFVLPWTRRLTPSPTMSRGWTVTTAASSSTTSRGLGCGAPRSSSPSSPLQKERPGTRRVQENLVVRRYGFYYRYDTEAERQTLAALWKVVCLKMNFFTATKKPSAGRRMQLAGANVCTTSPGRRSSVCWMLMCYPSSKSKRSLACMIHSIPPC